MAIMRSDLAVTPEGHVVWTRPGGPRRKLHGPAGRLDGHGYRQITIGQRAFAAHRIAFFLANGRWPEGEIDHINGVPVDNRPANLREVSRAQNQWNRKTQSGAKLAPKGVSWDSDAGKWAARITKDGKVHRLGRFASEQQAAEAYDAAAKQLFGEHARLHGGAA